MSELWNSRNWGRTNISPDTGEDVPPAVQLQKERERHADRAPRFDEPAAGDVVNVPDGVAGHENYYTHD